MPRKPKNKEITPPDATPEQGQTIITDKLQMELKTLADAVRLLSSGWKKEGNTIVREPSKDPAGMDWEQIAPDVRALFSINLLKSFSDAAIRTQYGQKALAILREVQDQTKIETQKLLDFLAEIEPKQTEQAAEAEIEEDSPPLELNGKKLVPDIEVKAYHGIDNEQISISKPAQKIGLAKSGTENNVNLPVEVKRGKSPVWVSVDIPNELLIVSPRITHYERAVEDAIGTLWAIGETPAVTERTVFLVMNGLPADAEVSKESLDKVHKAIERLSRIKAEITFPQEIVKQFPFPPELAKALEKDKKGDVVNWTLKGPIVQSDEITATHEVNGKKTKAWTITGRAPLFFLCSKLLGQVRAIPSKYMNVKYLTASGEERTRQNTENFIAMKHYLAVQVKRIEKKSEDAVRRVTLDSLISELELDVYLKKDEEGKPRQVNRAKKKRVVEDVTVILEHFKRTGFIIDYKIKKAGNEITGFDIEPRKRKRR